MSEPILPPEMSTPQKEAPTIDADIIEEAKGVTPSEASSFEGRKHFPIFPTNVFEFEVKDSEDLNKTLIENLGKIDNPNNLKNFSTSPTLCEGKDDFSSLCSLIEESVQQVLGFMNVKYDEVFVTTLQGHTVGTPEMVPPDTSPNNVFSGVYCAKAGGARASFYDPRPQAWVIRPAYTKAHIFNSDAFYLELREGTLAIFPAWLQSYISFPQEKEKEDVYFTWSAMMRDKVGSD